MITPTLFLAVVGLTAAAGQGPHAAGVPEDTIQTPDGPLIIGFVGHASLYFRYDGKVIHVDPVSREGDYSAMPKADLILITHAHGDHLDPDAIARIRTPQTIVVVAPVCQGKVDGAIVMKNGDTLTELGIPIEAVPAYNIVHKRPDGTPFHPKGEGDGYILTFGGTRVYVAGDTEDTPEMKALKDIDIAFLPMNLPYTMTPEMVADAAKVFRPRILYPYHYGDTDPQKLVALLKDVPGIEVRIRDMR
ncbi:MAG TPA: MBL fold metallo-hydrolase [Longimicrobiales bacterium]|nr:MBL fold metallo-hydrolase [Longimicrobiales bacterium]